MLTRDKNVRECESSYSDTTVPMTANTHLRTHKIQRRRATINVVAATKGETV